LWRWSRQRDRNKGAAGQISTVTRVPRSTKKQTLKLKNASAFYFFLRAVHTENPLAAYKFFACIIFFLADLYVLCIPWDAAHPPYE
jgi:hypothetical protein